MIECSSKEKGAIKADEGMQGIAGHHFSYIGLWNLEAWGSTSWRVWKHPPITDLNRQKI